jgi:hypothetical protein
VQCARPPIASPTPIDGFNLLKTVGNCSLYQVVASQSDYTYAPLLLDLYGSRHDQGYGYGFLLADRIDYTYRVFITALLGDKWWVQPAADLVFEAVDWQWDEYLSQQVPADFMLEVNSREHATDLYDELTVVSSRAAARNHGWRKRCWLSADGPHRHTSRHTGEHAGRCAGRAADSCSRVP